MSVRVRAGILLFSFLTIAASYLATPARAQQPVAAQPEPQNVAGGTQQSQTEIVTPNPAVRILPECSITKTNPDCKLVIDRENPLTPPAIQMYSNQILTVIVARPKNFERYFLDYQTGQATLTPDVASGIVQGLLPSLLKLQEVRTNSESVPKHTTKDDCSPEALRKAAMPGEGDELTAEAKTLKTCAAFLAEAAIPIYKALEPYIAPDSILPGSPIQPVALVDIQTQISNFVLLERALTSRISYISNNFKTPAKDQTVETLQDLATVQKVIDAVGVDLSAYSQRIADWGKFKNGSEPCADLFNPPKGKEKLNESLEGYCVLLQSRKDNDTVYNNMVTRSVTYGLDTLNVISNSQQAAPDPSKKKQLTTVTVNFADTKAEKSVVLPRSALRWEASAGAFFSTLPVRSFSVAPVFTGGVITDKVIAENILHPTVVPFAAANYRLTDDLKHFRWKSNIYLTGAVGVNPNTVTADFAAGVSWSYRALMVSGLAHFGHEVSLTQGLTVGRESWREFQRDFTDANALDDVFCDWTERAHSGAGRKVRPSEIRAALRGH